MDALLIVARTLHFAATASLEGVFAFWCFVARPAFRNADAVPLEGRLDRQMLVLAWASLFVAVVSGVAWLFIVGSQMSSIPLAAILPQGVLNIVLTQTQFGQDWRLRGLLCIVIALCLALQGRAWKRASSWLGLIASAAFVAALAWAGHGAAAEDVPWDGIHLPADLLHLIASGAWLGALPALALLLVVARRDDRPQWLEVARVATSRFSVLGVTCVATLTVTGIANTWFLAGSVPALIGTLYGQLLLVKVALFVAMVAIAHVNRNRLAPYLERIASEANIRARAIRRLGRNALIEATLGFLVLAIVGIIGVLPPGLHTEPVWPLPFQFDFNEIGAGAQTLLEVATVLFVVCLAAGAIAANNKRYRGATVALAGLVIFGGIGLLALRPGIARAYPTSFYAPTQPYAAPSIARGAPLYFANCAVCHGASGEGNGPLAATLSIRPADLTEEHIFAHSVGDIFWWVSHGRDDGVMPGFADKLTPDQRWDLINFVLARASAKQADATGSSVTAAAAPAVPDFAFEQQGQQNTLSQTLKTGPVLLVLYGAPQPTSRLQQLTAMEPRLLAAGLRVVAVGLAKPAGKAEASAAPALPAVVKVSDDVRAVLALFRSRADGGETELMLDRGAGVRARWTTSGPGGIPGSAALLADAVRVASIPVAAANHAGHAH
jgi:putative copper resistance protein D